MSHNNPNFYNNFTFHTTFIPEVPPPPMPPPFFIPPINPEKIDQDFVKTFESKILRHSHKQVVKQKPCTSISKVHNDIRNMVSLLNGLKEKQKMLMENIESLSDTEWKSNLSQIKDNKDIINKIMSQINDNHLDVLRKLIAKRSSKRMRLKRLRQERKKEKDEKTKEMAERSRKIDECLQKFQNNILKAKQEDESKIQSDMVLKEVLRKKNDAKKCLVKLDALVKLRKARQNTAKGKGKNVSEREELIFNSNIEKIKSMWSKKLVLYDKEEAELRADLMRDSLEQHEREADEAKRQLAHNLSQWRTALFGECLPHVDFGGNVAKFVGVRCQWDRYLDSEGFSLPAGWVTPSMKS